MTRSSPVGLGLLVALLLAAPAGAEEPYLALRTLGALQARIATGQADPAAQAAQLRKIAETFRAQPPEVWQRPQNRRALVSYLFSGGSPDVARAVMAGMSTGDIDSLVAGALAHSEADPRARDHLLPLDPKVLPNDIGGRLALMQGSLLVAHDASAARSRFDLARLLMPGTLVEEAALRRTVFLPGATDNAAAFADLVRRYRKRYTASPYAENFERQVRDLVVATWAKGSSPARIVVAKVIDGAVAPERSKIWAAITRRALMEAPPAVVREAAAHVLSDASADVSERRFAELAEFIAAAIAEPGSRAIENLRRVPERATPADRDLLRAAVMIADNIHAPLVAAKAGETTKPSDSPVESTIARAQQLLATP